MKKQRLINIYENLNENSSLSLRDVDALLDIAFGVCSKVHENGEYFWITGEIRVIHYILTKVKNAKDISEMKEDFEINLYKYFRE